MKSVNISQLCDMDLYISIAYILQAVAIAEKKDRRYYWKLT